MIANRPIGKSLNKGPWPSPVSITIGGFIRVHYRVAKESFFYVSSHLGTSLLVWLLIGIALGLPAGLYLLERNLGAMSEDWQGKPGISLYFELSASDEAIEAVAQRLRQDVRVRAVSLVSSARALEEFKAYSGLADALAVIEYNPLPNSMRAVLADGLEPLQLELLSVSLTDLPGVQEVVVEKTWLERVTAITELISRLGFMLAVLFGVAAILVTSTSVRLAIESRLDELKVLKLVGATSAYMRRPFLYFGLSYGMGGGVIGAMLVSINISLVEEPLAEFLGSYGGSLNIIGLDYLFVAGMLGIGGFLGIVGALMASRQRLADLQVD
ncbi:MAG: ABC transporter permease [Pseudomonadales bacterium]|nr:ABC transporter permease [Pseudomonadales bacterium]